MTRTIHECDCCGKEFPESEIYECNHELRTWKGYKMVPRRWELCIGCIKHLESVMESEAQRIKCGAISTDYVEYKGGHHDS